MEVLFSLLIILFAAMVRGYAGFGFSLLAISALSLIYKPAQILPSIFLLEIAASLHLLPSIWKDIHWKSLMPLIIGCLLATPLGVYVLASWSALTMQLIMSAFVLLAVALMWLGFALKQMPGRWASTATGAASGLANGAFGIGGPPAILFYFSSPAGNHVGRASIIVYFLFTDMIALANMAAYQLISSESFIRAALFLPVLLVGVWVGARGFKTSRPEFFRKAVLVIMAVLAILGAAKALYFGTNP